MSIGGLLIPSEIMMRNQAPFAMCLIGGILLIAANYTYGGGTIVLLYIFLHSISALSAFFLVIDIVLFILLVIAWLGGWAVILGGALLTTSWIRTGKFIIAIAAGFGLFSFILVILWVVLVQGLAGLLFLYWFIMNSAWALGLILTIIARSSAKKQR